MNEQLKKFNRGDIVLGKVIEIEPSKALIKIDDCEPVYIIKEVASTQKIESIEEVLQLNKIYEFYIATDYSARYYKTDESYLSIVQLEYWRSDKRLEQLAKENVTVYTTVIQSYKYGVLVNIENENFLVSNIHLKTQIPNQELVGQTIPLKVINFKTDRYNRFYASHRLALNSDRKSKNNSNSTTKEIKPTEKESKEHKLYALDDIDLNSIFEVDDEIKVIVVWMDIDKGRVAVSTKELEIEPGDMLKDPQLVYETSEKMAAKYRKLITERLDTSE